MTDDRRLFALVGATGLQGGASARALFATGARVRALVRDPRSAPAQDLTLRGAELVRADLDDGASLRSALDGVDALAAMTTLAAGGPAGEIAQGIALADAAASAGVRHVVYSSVGGADRHTGIPHFESKRRVEEHLESLDLRTTFVRPTFFMENLTRRVAPRDEDGTLVFRLPLPAATPIQMIATDDIGAVVVAALQTPDLVGPSIEIAGDEQTCEAIATALGAHAGVRARYVPNSLESIASDTDRHAMFAWMAEVPAYQADFAATRRFSPGVQDLTAWLSKIP